MAIVTIDYNISEVIPDNLQSVKAAFLAEYPEKPDGTTDLDWIKQKIKERSISDIKILVKSYKYNNTLSEPEVT